jgi:hypothetical protein
MKLLTGLRAVLLAAGCVLMMGCARPAAAQTITPEYWGGSGTYASAIMGYDWDGQYTTWAGYGYYSYTTYIVCTNVHIHLTNYMGGTVYDGDESPYSTTMYQNGYHSEGGDNYSNDVVVDLDGLECFAISGTYPSNFDNWVSTDFSGYGYYGYNLTFSVEVDIWVTAPDSTQAHFNHTYTYDIGKS